MINVTEKGKRERKLGKARVEQNETLQSNGIVLIENVTDDEDLGNED